MQRHRLLPALLLRALLLLALAATGAAAQTNPGYGDLLNTRPAPATEAPAAAPRSGPDLEAYGRIESVSTGELIDTATQQLDVFQRRLGRVVEAVPGTVSDIAEALSRNAPDLEPSFFLGVAVFMAILIIIGRGGTMLVAAYVFRPIMVGIQKPKPDGMVEKLPVLAIRIGLTVAGVAITLVVAAGLGAFFFDQHPPTLRTAIVIMAAYAAFNVVDTIWRMVVAPFLPNYRVPKLSDADAIFLYRYLSFASTVGIIALAFGLWLDLMGVREETATFVKIVLNGLTTLMLILTVVRNRRAISGAILSGRPRAEANWLATLAAFLWLPVFLLFVLGSWAISSFRYILGLDAPPGLVSAFLVFMVGIAVYAVTVYAVERIFARDRLIRRLNAGEGPTGPADTRLADYEGDSGDLDSDSDEEGSGGMVIMPSPRGPLPGDDEDRIPAAAPAPPARGMRSFEDLARRAASLFALGVAGFLALRIWVGAEILEEGTVWNLATDVIDTVFIGYIVFHAIRIWMDRRIAEEGSEISLIPGDEGAAATAVSRLGTLLPLLRTAVLLVVAVVVTLMVLMQAGVNVAPLFAGAGILGLAIGFGSQALVRDVLSGVFFLLDDAFRKGEYIDVGDVKGTVEKISLRSFQLRHHLGALNTIPFGEIKHLTNYSRDWVMMKLPLRLTYDTDVDKVRKIVKKLGEELLQHPVEGPKFLQPLKSQGVYMMEDSAMIIRVKYMTRPGDQWTTRKLVYQRIREVFEQNGVKFAHREVTVRIPDLPRDRPLTETELHAIGAASRRAVDAADEEMMLPRAVGDDR